VDKGRPERGRWAREALERLERVEEELRELRKTLEAAASGGSRARQGARQRAQQRALQGRSARATPGGEGQEGAGRRGKTAVEILREQGVVFESSLKGVRDASRLFASLEASGALVFKAGGERVAVDRGFWEAFKSRLSSIKTPSREEALASLKGAEARLFEKLVAAGLVYYDVKRGWTTVEDRPRAVVFDIDGVLVDSSERFRKAMEEVGVKDPKELAGEARRRFWEVFLSEKYLHLDTPNEEYIEKLREYRSQGYRIVILTGRPERMRKATEEQLKRLGIEYDEAVFRQEGDYSKDHEFKSKALEALKERYRVEAIYDDSEAVAEAASKLGIEAHLAGQGGGQGKGERARAAA